MACRRLAIVWLLVTSAGSASAGPHKMKAAALRHFEAGTALFERRRYPEAIREFDAGYALDPHPDFLYARAQALRLSGDCEGAAEDYRRFVATGPPAEEERLARRNLARCEEVLAAARPPAPPGPAATPPAPEPELPRPEPGPPPRPFYLDPWGDALAGVGVVGVSVGIFFLVSADRHVDAANDSGDTETWHRENDAVGRDRLIGAISLGVGCAAVAGGVVRWLLLPGGPEVGAAAGRDQAGVWVRGRF